MQKIVLATNNRHKIEELQQILCDYPFAWSSLEEFASPNAPEENGATYLENALIKARIACSHTGMPCLGDDSGLEVDALDGEPGLHSARFGGADSTQAQKIDLLLARLRDSAGSNRVARFRCVIAIAHPDGREWWAEACCPGLIAESPRGEHGFGYDPVFWIPIYSRTMAELTTSTKNRISHRALAAHTLMKHLFDSLPRYPHL